MVVRAVSLTSVVAVGGVVALTLILIGTVAPKFGQIFRDFGLQVPVLARAYISAGEALSSLGSGALVLVCLLSGMIAAMVAWIIRRNFAMGGLLAMLVVAACVLAAALMVAAFLPALVQLIESLQQQPAKP